MNPDPELFVCVKQPPASEQPVAGVEGERERAPELSPATAGRADAAALEEALRMRERGEVRRITCLTAGPPTDAAVLTWALTMGADRAVRLDVAEDARLDPCATGALLALAIWQLGGRLVFTGQRSDDGESGIVPASLAHTLGGVYLSSAAGARLGEGRVEIERRLERGRRQKWAASLPAVVAFEPALDVPRYVAVAALILARRRAIDTLTPAAVGVNLDTLPRLTTLKRLLSPRVRPKKLRSVSSDQSASERMSALMTGGRAGPQRRAVLKGDSEELAAAVVSLLRERNLLG